MGLQDAMVLAEEVRSRFGSEVGSAEYCLQMQHGAA